MIPLGVLAQRQAATGGGTFSPDDIAGLDLWLDASTLTGYSHGDDVGAWPDLSSASNNATQATAARKPHYDTSTGVPALLFDRSQYHYLISNAPADGTAHSVFVVIQSSGTTNIITPIGASATTGLSLDIIYQARPRIRAWGATSDITYATSGTTGITHVIGGVGDFAAGAGSVFIDDSVQTGSLNTVTPTAGRTIRVGIKGTSGEPMDGLIFEVLHYSAALSDTDRDAVRAYLADKYL